MRGLRTLLCISALAGALLPFATAAQVVGPYSVISAPLTAGDCVKASSAYQVTDAGVACGTATGTTGSTFTFQQGGVTGTLTWAPATSNKTLTLPNGTTDFTATGGTNQFLKQNAAGAALTVATIACADLSNGATGCATATGTSGATLPLLNGNNTYSGTATFSNATVIMSALASDSGAADSTVCVKTSDGTILKGSGTLGICLGTSSLRYKRDWRPRLRDGLEQIGALRPGSFFYKPGFGDGGARKQYGFLAEDVVQVIPTLVGLDSDGRPNTVDILGMVPVLVQAVQELRAENERLRRRVTTLEGKR